MSKKSPNTTNIQIHRDVGERLKEISEETGVTMLEVASQLLRQSFDANSIELTTKTVTFSPKRKAAARK